jgi:hypothetical protein
MEIEAKSEKAQRDGSGRFVKGHQVSQKNIVTRRRLEAVAKKGQLDKILKAIMTKAAEGDWPAQVWVAERMIPPLKAQAQATPFALDLTDMTAAAGSVMAAIASGELPADTGKLLLDSLNNTGQIGTLSQLAQKVHDLQAQIEARSPTAAPTAINAPVIAENDPDNTVEEVDYAEFIVDE